MSWEGIKRVTVAHRCADKTWQPGRSSRCPTCRAKRQNRSVKKSGES